MHRFRSRLWLCRLGYAVVAISMAVLLSAPLQAQGGFPPLVLQDALSGFAQPVFVGHAGDGSGRLFVVEQQGRVRIVRNGQLIPAPFIDITDRVLAGGERGLLGLAFPPDYATSGFFYVYYTAKAGSGDITISRFSRGPTADQANPASELPLLTIEHSAETNHNGGMLAFGPRDAYLYIATGDGGGGDDPNNNAQNPTVLLGKLLRIDVGARPTVSPPLSRRFLPFAQTVRRAGQQSSAVEARPEMSTEQAFVAQPAYAIPPGNPFVDRPNHRAEIWALGLRNPWRFSFDRPSAEMFIADVGQVAWEEVDWEAGGSKGGANYGWRVVEGPACNTAYGSTCDTAGYVGPIASYGRGEGVSITGGYVYRGVRWPALAGIYVFGDFGSGRIWGLRRDAGGWQRGLLLDSAARISSFGEDEAGELYLVDYGGTIYRLATN